jgi:hypothetical protein
MLYANISCEHGTVGTLYGKKCLDSNGRAAQDSQDRTTRAGQPGNDRIDRTVRILNQSPCLDRAAETGQPGHDSRTDKVELQ